MRDVMPAIVRWNAEGYRVALARVTETWGSAPRRPGAALVVNERGEVAGSVSGGCIEADVIREALATLKTGGRRLLTFGVDSETAWSVGLSCGGSISVLVQPFDPESEPGATWVRTLQNGHPLAIHTALEGTEERLDVAPALEASTGIADTPSGRVFRHVIPRPARLLIVGGADIAVHLVALARRLDFHITVLDPRAVFTGTARFDVAPDRLLTAWPQEVLGDFEVDEETYAVLLTHDPKIDDPALYVLLRSPARYIGALGGRKTQAARRDRLAAKGYSPGELSRIRGPAGIDIGSAGPADIALSILAEVVSHRNRTLPRPRDCASQDRRVSQVKNPS